MKRSCNTILQPCGSLPPLIPELCKPCCISLWTAFGKFLYTLCIGFGKFLHSFSDFLHQCDCCKNISHCPVFGFVRKIEESGEVSKGIALRLGKNDGGKHGGINPWMLIKCKSLSLEHLKIEENILPNNHCTLDEFLHFFLFERWLPSKIFREDSCERTSYWGD